VATVRRAQALRNPPRTICAVVAGVREFGDVVDDNEAVFGIAQWFPGRRHVPDLGPTEADFLAAYHTSPAQRPTILPYRHWRAACSPHTAPSSPLGRRVTCCGPWRRIWRPRHCSWLQDQPRQRRPGQARNHARSLEWQGAGSDLRLGGTAWNADRDEPCLTRHLTRKAC